MFYFKVEIPSNIITISRFDLDELDMIIYPSKNKGGPINPNHHNLLGIIFYHRLKNFDKKDIKNKLIQLIRFFNFLLPDIYSTEWIKRYSDTLEPTEENIQSTNNLNTYLSEIMETNESDINTRYKINLNEFDYPFNPFHNGKINFKETFLKFFYLPKQNELRNKIELLGLLYVLKLLIGPLYENDNLQKSLMFALIEHIINEDIKEKNTTKKCEYCEKTIPAQKGLNRKIKEYINRLNLNPDDTVVLIKIMQNMSDIRHKFFHRGKSITEIEVLENLKDKYGNSVSLMDELKDGDGRFSGFVILRNLFQKILLSQLANENPRASA